MTWCPWGGKVPAWASRGCRAGSGPQRSPAPGPFAPSSRLSVESPCGPCWAPRQTPGTGHTGPPGHRPVLKAALCKHRWTQTHTQTRIPRGPRPPKPQREWELVGHSRTRGSGDPVPRGLAPRQARDSLRLRPKWGTSGRVAAPCGRPLDGAKVRQAGCPPRCWGRWEPAWLCRVGRGRGWMPWGSDSWQQPAPGKAAVGVRGGPAPPGLIARRCGRPGDTRGAASTPPPTPVTMRWCPGPRPPQPP